ncbi:MAG: type IV pilin protein [Candidatus Avelusimicrobium sp.]|uniref:type IV pilin protein n=1 Tax=Candidatus Avelusimicrobium sp. TaxID=3048833 RepID=UPI003F028557
MYQKRGFTLIELLVVVLIIGILSAVALPQYTKAVEKARAAEAVTLGRALQEAQSVYRMANGDITQNLEDLDISLPEKTYFSFAIKDESGNIHAEHPKLSLFFEFSPQGVQWWNGVQWCAAGINDTTANAICRTYNPDIHHSNSTTHYYLMN